MKRSESAVEQFKRLSSEPFGWLYEEDPQGPPNPGVPDLTPMKNKAREAMDALNDAQKAADAGRAEDARQALTRAKAAIDVALGGQVAPGGFAPTYGSPGLAR